MDFSLNTYFDKIYVINMDADTDRLESITNELDKIHTKFIRMPGIIADKGLRSQEANFFGKYFSPTSAIGISEAHRKIWKTVVEKNYCPTGSAHARACAAAKLSPNTSKGKCLLAEFGFSLRRV
jgi:hypothetical protein